MSLNIFLFVHSSLSLYLSLYTAEVPSSVDALGPGLVQQLLTVKSTRPNGKSCAKESDRILLLPPTCRARDVELMTASHVWLDDIVKDVIELGRVQSNDSAVEGSRFDMQHMQEQMLCSVQVILFISVCA